jgi:drug/metabolite transporter (DMT)-like permease
VKRGFGTGLLLAFAAAVVWGAQLPIAKDAFASIDAFHVTAFRYGTSVLVLLAVLAWTEGMGALGYDGRARQALAIGFTGMTLSPLLVFWGLALGRPEVTAVIVAMQPAMAAIAEWIYTGKRPPRFTLACIAVAFVGVFTVVTRWSVDLAPRGIELVGNVMILLGAFCWVIYTMASARFRGWSTLRYTALTMLPGAVGTVGFTVAAVALGFLAFPAPQQWASVWPHLAFLSVFGVLLSMVAWNYGTQRIGALNAVLFLNLLPVVAFFVGWLRGQRFSVIELVGAGIVIAALAANNLYLRRGYARAAAAAASPG